MTDIPNDMDVFFSTALDEVGSGLSAEGRNNRFKKLSGALDEMLTSFQKQLAARGLVVKYESDDNESDELKTKSVLTFYRNDEASKSLGGESDFNEASSGALPELGSLTFSIEDVDWDGKPDLAIVALDQSKDGVHPTYKNLFTEAVQLSVDKHLQSFDDTKDGSDGVSAHLSGVEGGSDIQSDSLGKFLVDVIATTSNRTLHDLRSHIGSLKKQSSVKQEGSKPQDPQA